MRERCVANSLAGRCHQDTITVWELLWEQYAPGGDHPTIVSRQFQISQDVPWRRPWIDPIQYSERILHGRIRIRPYDVIGISSIRRPT